MFISKERGLVTCKCEKGLAMARALAMLKTLVIGV
jgi:hypothetical protein